MIRFLHLSLLICILATLANAHQTWGQALQKVVEITARTANIYEYPSIYYPVIHTAKQGETYRYLGTTDNWYAIQINSKRGWIMKKWCSLRVTQPETKPQKALTKTPSQPPAEDVGTPSEEKIPSIFTRRLPWFIGGFVALVVIMILLSIRSQRRLDRWMRRRTR